MPVYSTINGGGGAGSSVVYSTIISISHGGLDGFGVPGTTNAFSSGVVIFSGSNISLATSADGVSQYIQMTAGVGAGAALQGSGAYTQNSGTIRFMNSNGITFGLETNGTMTASHNAYYATSQLSSKFLTTAALSDHAHTQYLTTAALSNHTHSNLYIALADSTKYATSYLSATFQTTGAYLTTAANSTHTHSQYLNTSASSLLQHTSATSAITASAMNTSERSNYFYTSNNTFANSTHSHGNVSLALTNLTGTTASASNGMTLSVSALAGGTLSLINSNNISFGTSTSGNTTSVTASVGKVHFVNSNGFSWSSSTASGNTSYWIITA